MAIAVKAVGIRRDNNTNILGVNSERLTDEQSNHKSIVELKVQTKHCFTFAVKH